MSSKTKRFYSGDVVSAEISKRSPRVNGWSRHEPSRNISDKDKAYALIAVRLEKGRGISIYDYVLVDNAMNEFVCKGIRLNDNAFDRKNWEHKNTQPSQVYGMLFE